MGSIRVGRSTYYNRKTFIPEYDGYTTIVVLTEKTNKYGAISPYSLRNEQGQLIENVYQFSKCYKTVPTARIPYSSGQRQIVWEWPAENHIDDDGNFTEEFWKWRLTGKNHKQPVRNPVGWKHLKECIFSLEKDGPISESNPKLDYIEARKKIYVPQYLSAVKTHDLFHELKNRLNNGENLLIVEIDGPHQESLDYYKDKYNVSDDFIQLHSMQATAHNLAIMLNDPKHPFGHGYCLALALMVL